MEKVNRSQASFSRFVLIFRYSADAMASCKRLYSCFIRVLMCTIISLGLHTWIKENELKREFQKPTKPDEVFGRAIKYRHSYKQKENKNENGEHPELKEETRAEPGRTELDETLLEEMETEYC